MSDQPPPYLPPPPGFPSAFSSQPAAFPGSPYQMYTGDHSYYQGPPGPYLTQPGSHEYQSGPPGTPHPWDGPKMYGDPSKHAVFLVEQNRNDGGGRGGGAGESCLAACSAALCCCCLWDVLSLLSHHAVGSP